MNSQVYDSLKKLNGIDCKKSSKGKHDDKDDFDGILQSPFLTEQVASNLKRASLQWSQRNVRKERVWPYCKQVVGKPIIHKSDYSRISAGAVVISSSYKKVRNMNRADKGDLQLNKLLLVLKSVTLSEGTNVNVDDTCLWYRTIDEKRKIYMWCLVNKKARIVIFFYEDRRQGR